MLRFVNLYNNYIYQDKIAIILDYANSATLKLSDYKLARTNWLNYIQNDNIKNWNRSTFDEHKKKLSNDILNNISIKPFSLISELYDIIKNNNIIENKEISLNLLLEITYYIYRLNEKLFEYENNPIEN